MSTQLTSSRLHHRWPYLVGITGCVVFLALWIAALVPFFSHGMHHYSHTSLEYAGEPKAGFNIDYAPVFQDVYGSSTLAGNARLLACFSPLVLLVALGVVLRRFLIACQLGYSRREFGLRTLALLTVLALFVATYVMANKFFVWGLG